MSQLHENYFSMSFAMRQGSKKNRSTYLNGLKCLRFTLVTGEDKFPVLEKRLVDITG